MEIKETIIRLTENNLVEIETVQTNGKSSVKEVIFDEFCDLIHQIRYKETEKAQSYNSGILPYNELSGVRTIATKLYDDGKKVIFLYRKPMPTTITYYESVFENVGMPGLVFAVTIGNNQVRTVRVCAVKEDVLTESTKVYRYPLSNVSSIEGRICFGRNNIFDIDYKETSYLHSIPSMFLAMPNNDDSYGKIGRAHV